jgi:hypothetical protein
MVPRLCFRRSSSEKENGFFGTGIVSTHETSSRNRENQGNSANQEQQAELFALFSPNDNRDAIFES